MLKLDEMGEYFTSESTIYRILHQEDQLAHCPHSTVPHKRSKPRLVARGGGDEV